MINKCLSKINLTLYEKSFTAFYYFFLPNLSQFVEYIFVSIDNLQ